jgi:hypothetical protein
VLEAVFEVEFISIFCYVKEVRSLLIPTKLTSGTLYFKNNYGIVIMCISAIINATGVTMLDTQSLALNPSLK